MPACREPQHHRGQFLFEETAAPPWSCSRQSAARSPMVWSHTPLFFHNKYHKKARIRRSELFFFVRLFFADARRLFLFGCGALQHNDGRNEHKTQNIGQGTGDHHAQTAGHKRQT